MELIADTHVHIYPNFDAARLIAGAAKRMGAHAITNNHKIILCLTETHRDDFFERLLNGTHGLPAAWEVAPSADDAAVRVELADSSEVFIIAGRQIVAAERVEILGLAMRDLCEDGLPAVDVVSAVLENGGVPVLAWAPGKWMFSRARVVADLAREFGAERLCLGDSSMRPIGWPEPRLMGRSGLNVLAGSDPLPVVGEEAQAGCYGVRINGDFDTTSPAESLRNLLLSGSTEISCLGRRNQPWQLAQRMLAHRQQKQAS